MLLRCVRFYAEGFRSMSLGRTLWLLIGVKLVVIFLVLKLLFFPAALTGSEEEKGSAVSDALMQRSHTVTTSLSR
ncbi:MAG: DUF4492 domain-containing protein [Akkermansia sp.]